MLKLRYDRGRQLRHRPARPQARLHHRLLVRQVRRLSLLPARTIQQSRRPHFEAQTLKTLTRGYFASKRMLCTEAFPTRINCVGWRCYYETLKPASDWYGNLDNGIKANWTTLKNAFKQRFQDTEILRWRKANELWPRVQGPSESVTTT